MTPSSHSELRKSITSLKRYTGHLFLLSTTVGLLGIIPVAYMREVYGPVVTVRSEEALIWVTLLLLLGLGIAGTLEWVRQRVQSAMATKLTALLGSRSLEVSFAANLQGRKSANAALNDLRVLKNFLVSSAFATAFEVPVGFIFLGLIYFINPLMGTISVLGGLLILIVGVIAELAARPLLVASMDAASRASTLAVETTRNAQVVEAMGMGPSALARWWSVQSQFMALNAQAGQKQSTGMAVSKAITLIQGSAMIGIGTALTLMGHISPALAGLFIVAKFIGAIAMRPFMQLISSWKQIEMAIQAYKRLDETLASFPPRAAGMSLPKPNGHLTLSNAYVRPPGTKSTVLQGLTLALGPGQILVVLGSSGSGKSSFARVVTGLWPCSSGDARLDGASLADWSKEELGKYLGYLPQDVELFDGTIRDNIIRFGEFNQREYDRVVGLTHMADIIEQLPNGDHTELGLSGATLSGGQRQRVGLARALYGSPQLIVLDEPNSSLDERGDIALRSALEHERAGGATIVLITHRTEVVKLADLILVLKDGRQAAFGSTAKVKAALQNAGNAHQLGKGGKLVS